MQRRGLALGLVIAAFVAADCGVWLWVCARLERSAAEAIETVQHQGWTIQSASRVRRGWPFAAELEFAAVFVQADPAVVAGGLAWTADRVTLRLSLAHPTTLALAASGQQTLRLQGLEPIPFTARAMELALTQSAPPALTVAGLQAGLPQGPLAVGAATLRLPPDGLALEAERISLPRISPGLDRLGLQCSLTAPIPPGATPAARLGRWRQSGGALEVQAITLNWGSLAANGHAVLRLDPQLQPAGSGTVNATGLAPALDMLAQSGALPSRTALAAKAVLALLAAPAQGQAVSLPILLQDSVLSVARFPLLRLPSVRWDGS